MKNDEQNTAEHHEDVEACLATPKGTTRDQDDLEGMTRDELVARVRTLGGMLKQRVREVDRLYQEGRSPRGVIEMLQLELRAEREKVASLQRRLWEAVPAYAAPIAGMTFPFTIDTPHRDTVEITVTGVDITDGVHRVRITADIRLPEAQPQEVPPPVGEPTFVEVRDVPGVVTQLSLAYEQTGAASIAAEEDAHIAARLKEAAKAATAKLTASAADTNENYAHLTEGTENMKNTATVMSTELIPFHGSMLEAGKADDKVWVSVRRMCEPLDLGFNGQHDKLASQERAPWAVTRVMRMTGPDGKIYETFCLELDCVPMWLATLDSSRVAPHLREKIVLFQREAAKALRDHFFKAPKPAPPPTRAEIARMLLIECERAEKLEAEKQVLEHTVDTLVAEVEAVDARNAELEPIVETHKELTDANGLSSMTQVAMSIKEGLQRLYQWLREDGFIQPSPSCLPYQQHIDNGLFDLICVPYQKKDKKGVMVDHVRYVTHATAKGLTVLAARYRRGGTHSRWDKPMKRTKKVKPVPTL